MGIVAGLSAAAAGASLAGSVSNLVGGSGGSGGYGSPGSVPQGYQGENSPQADTNYQYLNWGAPGSMQNLALQGYGNVYNLTSNPYGLQSYVPGLQSAADMAGGYLSNTVAPMEAGASSRLYGAGNQLYQTAFDPQSALYNVTQQQVADQANAINAASGLSNTPYGAGVAGNTLSNFNIDWQNQQLQRQLQGVQGVGQAYTGAAGLGQSAAQAYQQGGALPYTTYLGQQNDALNALATGQGLDSNTLNALAAYLRLGQSATATGQQGASIAGGLQNQQFNQQQQMGSQAGSALQSLSNLFSGSSGNAGATYSGVDPYAQAGTYQNTASPYTPVTDYYSAMYGGP